MIIETLEVAGFRPAIKAMRNPMDSWLKSDSEWSVPQSISGRLQIGEKDRELSARLQKAGPEHCKHLRMIVVWADISAPRYWWTEADTYRHGVEKVSCSTMHRLMARELGIADFECDAANLFELADTVEYLNGEIESYRTEADPEIKKDIWRGIIQALPQSYIQKRTVMFSYAALRTIYRQREGHKLVEWQQFREWIETLPESWMITDNFC